MAGPALNAHSIFRVASNTKPYVAVTILRLWEDGLIDLDASIRTYVDPAYLAVLDGDGYDTAHMTVRHLLSHTSGLADHAQTQQFLDAITTHPATAWTRASHLEALARWTDPVGRPGEKFAYSDPGYQLLGHIVEKLTGMPLAAAVRATLRFDQLGLRDTYWETQEPAPERRQRVHQFLHGHDTYDWNPTLDMYGGGGLVATPEDLARFLFALFEGKVFKRPATLAMMLSREGLPKDSPYRLGLFEYDKNGVHAYWHSGFWGTAAMYVPATHHALAFALTQQEGFKPAFDALRTAAAQTAQ
jgi:D-alanyl-D-alanine carboxypeptidase